MASPPNPISTWSDYFASTIDKPLHPLYAELAPLLPERGSALELGAGVGHGVVHLLECGLSVTAVDAEREACEIIRRRAPGATVIESRFEALRLIPESFDLVVAGFCLFFLTSEAFDAFWPRLVSAIKPGGLFAGQFMGLNDEWVPRGYLGQSEEQITANMQSFDILYREEVDRDGFTSIGVPKHWHVFHVIGRKKTTTELDKA